MSSVTRGNPNVSQMASVDSLIFNNETVDAHTFYVKLVQWLQDMYVQKKIDVSRYQNLLKNLVRIQNNFDSLTDWAKATSEDLTNVGKNIDVPLNFDKPSSDESDVGDEVVVENLTRSLLTLARITPIPVSVEAVLSPVTPEAVTPAASVVEDSVSTSSVILNPNFFVGAFISPILNFFKKIF